MSNSQKPGSLRKVRCGKVLYIDKISTPRTNFKSICYIDKLKGLPKIQRSVRNACTCARRIFVNGVMKRSESMTGTMKTRYRCHRAFTLQEEADEHEWSRSLLHDITEIRENNISQKIDKK